MTTRRAFIGTLTGGLLAAPLAAEAQPAKKVWRIGCLWGPTLVRADMEAFREGLRKLGYVEGRDVAIELRFAEGRVDRLPGLAAELVRLKVDVILTVSGAASLAAQKATSDIPIIFTIVPDPVALGLVRTLARPGGNVTGFTALQVALAGKRLELLKEAIPSLKSVALLTDPANPTEAFQLQEAQSAARKLRLGVRIVEVRLPGELQPAVAAVAQDRLSALVIIASPFLFTHRVEITALAIKARLPVLGWQRQLVDDGALISYGPNHRDIFWRAATYVDKILKGAKPGDLPVEEPTKFELVINLKTAKALGLTIPPSVLGRADEVIQ